MPGRAGYKTGGRGGSSEVLPLRKVWGGGAEIAMPKGGGHKQFWGSYYAIA